MRRRQRAGFTILELLVVIGILAVLMALLFPLIRRVRVISLNTLCANRLHDLAQASLWSLQQKGQFPGPSMTYGPGLITGLPANVPVPHQLETRLLNDLSTPLAFAPLTGGVSSDRLPPRLQCPFIEPLPARGPTVFQNSEYYYTGYVYCVGLGVLGAKPPVVAAATTKPTAFPTVLQDHSVPLQTGDSDGVLWADDVHCAPTGWQYAHADSAAVAVAGSAKAMGPPVFADTTALKGQHRAYTDGSVRWVPAAALKLDPSIPRDASATFKIGSAFYWWF